MGKLNENFVKEYIEKRGYIFISLFKMNDLREITFEDKSGYKYKTSWENFKNSKNFKPITYSNPFSVENAKLYLKLNNIPIVLKSNEIKDVSTPLLFIGECGHEIYISWNKMKRRKNFLCSECQNKRVGDIKRLTLKEVEKEYECKGLHIKNIENYKNNETKLNCYDDNGYQYHMQLSNLFKYSVKVIVDKRNPYSIKNIKTYLKNVESDSILLSKEYQNEKQELLLQCSCGNIFKMSWSNIRGNEHICCKNCYEKIKNEKINSRRLDFDIVYNMFKSKGFQLLEKNYERNCKRMLCKDKENYKYLISYNSLFSDKIKIGERYSLKHLPKDIVIYNLNNYAKNNNIKSVVLDILEKSKYLKNEIKIKCECGEIYIAPLYSFVTKISKCSKCSKSISSLEYKVKLYLESSNIEFVQEKRFKDCRNILPLPFDFYIPNKNLLIECDGEGHYFPCNFNQCSKEDGIKSFELTKHNNKIKDIYCKSKNIKLLRIPYWEFKTDKWKNKINQWLI